MLIILDAGHGGINPNTAQYVTPGKRSPIWSNGKQLFEGVFNRAIVNKLHKLCQFNSIDSHILVPQWEDISLEERKNRVNLIYKKRNDAILLSVHANAGGGTGFEMFTSKGSTSSDKIADILIKEYQTTIPQLKLRKDTSDGDLDKEIDFYLIKRTFCPAVLIECAFMDTYIPDCKMMLEDEDIFVEAIFNGILELKVKGY